MLNANAKRWSDKLEKLLKQMPDDIELILGYGGIDILPRGTYNEKLCDCDMMKEGGNLISENSLMTISIDQNRFRPNSESI